MTAAQHRGNAPVAATFAQAALLPASERRAYLLGKFWATFQAAQERYYLNKSGKEIPNPDGATAVKVLTAVTVLFEQDPELEEKAREAKRRIATALERLPALVAEVDATAQKRAVLEVLRDAAVVAALKPQADVNGAVGVFRVVAQVLGLTGEDDGEATPDELRAALRQLEGKTNEPQSKKSGRKVGAPGRRRGAAE